MAPKVKAKANHGKPTEVKPSEAPETTKPAEEEYKGDIELAVIWAVGLLAVAALASPVSQLNLSPVYGSIPSARFHAKGLMWTSLTAFMGKTFWNKRLPKRTAYFIPVLGYYIPVIQWAVFRYSGTFGPVYGPLLTEALTYYPFLMLCMYVAATTLDDLDLSALNPNVAEMIPAVGSYVLVSGVQKYAASTLPSYVGSSDFFSRSGLQLIVASLSAALTPSIWLLLAIPASFHTMRINQHNPSAPTTALLNSTLATQNFTLIERRESLTGYLSVLESTNNAFRVLRCDHSLLGGNWLTTPQRASQGQTGLETIYAVFTMLESVRLISGQSSRPDSEKSALVIGLGIGTSPTAFINHGINTTIVELDPVVHEFATKYFELPPQHTAYLEDAVPFVSSTAETQPESYDYIIHDVFTGGAEPAALFTHEFLSGLHSLLMPDGVVAINYAGDLAQQSPKLIMNTIFSVFASCRIFRDTELDDPGASDFVNMVVFCTKSAAPITFRKPEEGDWLGSLARRHFVPPSEKLEIKFEELMGRAERKVFRKGMEEELERFHAESAVKHWRIMRTVLPDAVWELW